MTSRDENTRIHREYQEFIEALAAVDVELFAAEASDDEATYNAIYEAKFQPIYNDCRRSIGIELAVAAVEHAATLARLSA